MREMKNEFQALRLRQQLPELNYGAGGRAPRKGPLAVLLPSFLDAQERPARTQVTGTWFSPLLLKRQALKGLPAPAAGESEGRTGEVGGARGPPGPLAKLRPPHPGGPAPFPAKHLEGTLTDCGDSLCISVWKAGQGGRWGPDGLGSSAGPGASAQIAVTAVVVNLVTVAESHREALGASGGQAEPWLHQLAQSPEAWVRAQGPFKRFTVTANLNSLAALHYGRPAMAPCVPKSHMAKPCAAGPQDETPFGDD